MSLDVAPDPVTGHIAQPDTRTAGVSGWGAALPETVVTNEAVAEGVGVTPEWIVKRTGIRERRHLAPGERLDALCVQAGREALAQAGLEGSALDAVIVATSTPDGVFPQAAPIVAGQLGAERALNWDVNIACTGFVAGLAQGAALIESGRAENVLLVGGDAISRCIDPTNRGSVSLFADGAGAAVLTLGGEGRIGATVMGSDGASADFLVAAREDSMIRMEGAEVFRHAIKRMAEAGQDALAREGLTMEDVTLVVPHQANGRITDALAEKLELTDAQVVDDIGDRGNTSAATIPLALHRAAAEGRIPERGHVLLVAFGAGFAWGATVLHFGGAS